MFKNKTLLITGGTGSFGKKMLTYCINNTNIKQIRIFSRDEEKQDKMRLNFKDERIKYFLGDIRNPHSIEEAMCDADYVFHAAALKQVPSCEFFPMEAVSTNIVGANNVIDVAIKNKVKKLVVLSTDKAVYPINAMGMSKALMEKIMISKSRINSHKTVLVATRYGNVMASRGSVIPLFIKQCKANDPITITNPNMTRFLMSLDESISLVLFALSNAKTGDILVQKAEATTIYNLALAIKELFNKNAEIKIIGIRHGEKEHETLINREEMSKAEDLGNFFRIPADNRDLHYDKYLVSGCQQITPNKEYNSFNTVQLSKEQIIDRLLSLEYIQKELSSKEFIGAL